MAATTTGPSTSTFSANQLSDIIECPICYNVYNKPLQLSCGHTLCASCIDRLVENARAPGQNAMAMIQRNMPPQIAPQPQLPMEFHAAAAAADAFNAFNNDILIHGLGGMNDAVNGGGVFPNIVGGMGGNGNVAGNGGGGPMRGLMPFGPRHGPLIMNLPGQRNMYRAGRRGANGIAAGTEIKCPECRKPTIVPPEGLSVNYRVQDIVAKMAASTAAVKNEPMLKPRCNVCDEALMQGVYFDCTQCGEDGMKLCSTCAIRTHNGHEVVEKRAVTDEDVKMMKDKISRHAGAAFQAMDRLQTKLTECSTLLNEGVFKILQSHISHFEKLASSFDNRINTTSTIDELDKEIENAEKMASIYQNAVNWSDEKLVNQIKEVIQMYMLPMSNMFSALGINMTEALERPPDGGENIEELGEQVPNGALQDHQYGQDERRRGEGVVAGDDEGPEGIIGEDQAVQEQQEEQPQPMDIDNNAPNDLVGDGDVPVLEDPPQPQEVVQDQGANVAVVQQPQQQQPQQPPQQQQAAPLMENNEQQQRQMINHNPPPVHQQHFFHQGMMENVAAAALPRHVGNMDQAVHFMMMRDRQRERVRNDVQQQQQQVGVPGNWRERYQQAHNPMVVHQQFMPQGPQGPPQMQQMPQMQQQQGGGGGAVGVGGQQHQQQQQQQHQQQQGIQHQQHMQNFYNMVAHVAQQQQQQQQPQQQPQQQQIQPNQQNQQWHDFGPQPPFQYRRIHQIAGPPPMRHHPHMGGGGPGGQMMGVPQPPQQMQGPPQQQQQGQQGPPQHQQGPQMQNYPRPQQPQQPRQAPQQQPQPHPQQQQQVAGPVGPVAGPRGAPADGGVMVVGRGGDRAQAGLQNIPFAYNVNYLQNQPGGGGEIVLEMRMRPFPQQQQQQNNAGAVPRRAHRMPAGQVPMRQQAGVVQGGGGAGGAGAGVVGQQNMLDMIVDRHRRELERMNNPQNVRMIDDDNVDPRMNPPINNMYQEFDADQRGGPMVQEEEGELIIVRQQVPEVINDVVVEGVEDVDAGDIMQEGIENEGVLQEEQVEEGQQIEPIMIRDEEEEEEEEDVPRRQENEGEQDGDDEEEQDDGREEEEEEEEAPRGTPNNQVEEPLAAEEQNDGIRRRDVEDEAAPDRGREVVEGGRRIVRRATRTVISHSTALSTRKADALERAKRLMETITISPQKRSSTTGNDDEEGQSTSSGSTTRARSGSQGNSSLGPKRARRATRVDEEELGEDDDTEELVVEESEGQPIKKSRIRRAPALSRTSSSSITRRGQSSRAGSQALPGPGGPSSSTTAIPGTGASSSLHMTRTRSGNRKDRDE